jgi:hypothetical protein
MERKVIYASEGKILTNGEIYGKQIHLAEGVSEDSFYEISEEEYNALMALKEVEYEQP